MSFITGQYATHSFDPILIHFTVESNLLRPLLSHYQKYKIY